MALVSVSRETSASNPIDLLEEVVSANDWRFERTADAEMVIELTGSWCDYRMHFVWHEDLAALYFSCMFDLRVPRGKRAIANELLALINEKLLLGHFDLCSEELVPMFRHTLLLRGMGGVPVEQFEDMVDIAVNECERFYPAFQFVLWGGKSPADALAAALLETIGEA